MLTTKKVGLWIVVLAFVTIEMSATADAQFRDVPPKYEEFHLVNLLGFPSVRKHLAEDFGLSEEAMPQLKDLGSVRLKNMHRRKNLRFKTRKMSDEKFDKARAALLRTIQQANQQNWVKAKALLTEAQIDRLKQLRVQRLGVAALTDPEVIKALGLDKDQIKSAMKLHETYNKKMLALKAAQHKQVMAEKLQPQSQESYDRNVQLLKEREEAKVAYSKEVYEAVLDDIQLNKFTDMSGKAFQFRFDFDFPKMKVQWHTDPLKRESTSAPHADKE